MKVLPGYINFFGQIIKAESIETYQSADIEGKDIVIVGLDSGKTIKIEMNPTAFIRKIEKARRQLNRQA